MLKGYFLEFSALLIITFLFLQCVPKEPTLVKNTIYEEWYMRTNDGEANILVREFGKGDTVVVLHGGPGMPHEYMLDVADGLENMFHFVFYDQRGSRSSPLRVDSVVTIEKHVDDLERLRETLGLEKINIISHSAGTTLFYNYMLKYPERVKNVAMVGAIPPKNGDTDFFSEEEIKSWDMRVAQMDSFYTRPQLDEIRKKLNLNREVQNEKERWKQHVLTSAAQSGVYDLEDWNKLRIYLINNTVANQSQQSVNWVYNHKEMLSSHPHKLTVINGKYDLVVEAIGSPIWSTFVREDAPNIDLVILDKACHHPWLDKPEEFRESITQALR